MKVARDGHGGGVGNWLTTLLAQAAQSDWPHLDLLIDQANLPPRWQKKLPQALALRQMLLQGTAHVEAADEAALLCRYQLGDERAWTRLLACLGELEGAPRLMVLHSDWPFASLTNHLRYFCLAQWHDGHSHGVLRYYNPQQFLPALAALPETQVTMLLQCADRWHWLDRDGIACQLPVPEYAAEPFLLPDEPLTLDDAAVSRLSAWHQAELYVQDMLQTPRQCGCLTKEAMMQKLFTLQMAADERQLWSQSQRAYFIDEAIENGELMNFSKIKQAANWRVVLLSFFGMAGCQTIFQPEMVELGMRGFYLVDGVTIGPFGVNGNYSVNENGWSELVEFPKVWRSGLKAEISWVKDPSPNVNLDGEVRPKPYRENGVISEKWIEQFKKWEFKHKSVLTRHHVVLDVPKYSSVSKSVTVVFMGCDKVALVVDEKEQNELRALPHKDVLKKYHDCRE